MIYDLRILNTPSLSFRAKHMGVWGVKTRETFTLVLMDSIKGAFGNSF